MAIQHNNITSFPSHHYHPYHDKTRSPHSHKLPLGINRLPGELLVQVYIYYLQEHRHPKRKRPPPLTFPHVSALSNFLASPLVLSNVCSRWRNIASSSPSLWSTIYINKPSNKRISIVGLWLSRAGSHPLTLSLRQSRKPDKEECWATARILSLLIQRLHCWKDVRFTFFSTPPWILFTSGHGMPLLLESIMLHVRCWDYTPRKIGPGTLWHTLQSSPSLRHIDWCNWNHEPPSHAPWTQLTDIALRVNITVPDVLAILGLCHEARIINIQGLIGSSYASFAPHTPVTLQNLHSLTVFGYIDAGLLLDHLTLPALVSLDITRVDLVPTRSEMQFEHCRSLGDFLTRSSCQLEEFAFCDTKVAEGTLLMYLQLPQLRSLRKLKLTAHVTDLVVTLLTYDVVGGVERLILPDLRAIDFKLCHASDDVLAKMIASRHMRRRVGLEPLKIQEIPSVKVVQLIIHPKSSRSCERDMSLLSRRRHLRLYDES